MGGALPAERATAVFAGQSSVEGVSDRVADEKTGRSGAGRTARRGAESRLGLVPPARAGGRRTLSKPPAAAAARPRPPRPRFRLTRRATILALALCAVVVTIAYPLQEYLAQRSALIAINKQNADLTTKDSDLQKQISLWSDPGYVAVQAREQLHYVKPGEEGFTVPGPANGAEQLGLPAPTATPWYDTLWGSVKSPGATVTGNGR
jgi:cell division protein FtsB